MRTGPHCAELQASPDGEVPLLPGDGLNERLQFLLRGLALPKLDGQAGAEAVNVFLQQDRTLIRGQESGVQIIILVL